MNKKILFLILIIAPFLMGMKVVYENETGKVVAVGPFVNYKTADGQSVMEVKDADPGKIADYVVDKDVLRVKTSEEKQVDTAAKDKDKTDRKTRKKAVLTKLGLDSKDVQGLQELIQDGNDN